METLIILFIGYIIFSNVIGGLKKNATKSIASRKSAGGSNPWNQAGASAQQNATANVFERYKKQEKMARAGKNVARTQAAQKLARKVKDEYENAQNNRKSSGDMNRHRVGNWGERAGPGIFTLTNIFAMIVFAIILLYTLSSI